MGACATDGPLVPGTVAVFVERGACPPAIRAAAGRALRAERPIARGDRQQHDHCPPRHGAADPAKRPGGRLCQRHAGDPPPLLATWTRLRWWAADKPDTFDIDFSGGNPIPPDGLTLFGGGQPASSDNNSIVLQSAPAASPISSLVNQPIGFGQGSLQLQAGGSGGTIGYTRVNFIEDTVATQSAVLDDALSGDSLVIGSPPGGDQVTVTSAQAPTVAFTVSPDSLTVDTTGRTDPPADAIDIQSLQSNTPMNLTVQTAAGDTIGISGTSDLYGGNLSVTGSSIQIAGTFTSGGQTYNGPVELQADAELASTTAGDITFNGTVDGAHLLDVETAGTQTFNGTVGGQHPVGRGRLRMPRLPAAPSNSTWPRGEGRGGRRGGFVDVGRRGLLQYRQ